jgi:hypothetical protein
MSDDCTFPEWLIQVAAETIPVDPDDTTTIIGWERDEAIDRKNDIPVWGPPEVVAKGVVEAVLRALADDAYKMAGWANEGARLDALADEVSEVSL